MDSLVTKQLLQFFKDVKQMNPENKPVFLNTSSKPFELTFYAFVVAWYPKTVDLLSEGEIAPVDDPMSMLRTEHTSQLLKAVLQGERVPLDVLREARFRSELYKPI